MVSIERQLQSMMETDTTMLYFNIDNMRKLTQVILNLLNALRLCDQG